MNALPVGRIAKFLATRTGKCIAIATGVICLIFAVNCFTSRTIIKTDIRLKSYERTKRLCLLKVFDTFVITNTVNGVTGTFIAPCDAILAMDFPNIDIVRSNDWYHVKFPPIYVYLPRVDRTDDSFKTWNVSAGLRFFASDDPVRQAAMQEAERRIQETAMSDRYVKAAQAQAKKLIESLLKSPSQHDSLNIDWTWQTTPSESTFATKPEQEPAE